MKWCIKFDGGRYFAGLNIDGQIVATEKQLNAIRWPERHLATPLAELCNGRTVRLRSNSTALAGTPKEG